MWLDADHQNDGDGCYIGFAVKGPLNMNHYQEQSDWNWNADHRIKPGTGWAVSVHRNGPNVMDVRLHGTELSSDGLASVN